MIRLVIAEDHGVVRAGLERLLGNADDIEVVGTASDGRQAVDRCLETNPDLVVMDLNMPEMDGIEATRVLHERLPSVNVVVLTSLSDRDRILGALDAGAVGYLLKDVEPEDLIAGVRAAARGESPLTPKAASALVAARAETRSVRELSSREEEVLRLLAEGLANKQIARRLGISEKTVKSHLTNLFRRIGVEDRTQAALWAERRGLTRPAAG